MPIGTDCGAIQSGGTNCGALQGYITPRTYTELLEASALYMPLNETTGTNAANRQGADGTYVSLDPATDSVDGLAPNSPRAQMFDGVDDYMAGNGMTVGTNDLSVSCWVQTSMPTTGDRFGIAGPLSTTSSKDGKFGIYLQDGKAKVTFDPSDGFTITSTTLINDGVPHHVAFSADRDGNLTIYIDGVAEAIDDISTHSAIDMPLPSGIAFDLGHFSTGSSPDKFLNGIIDEVIAMPIAITIDEIENLYAGPPPTPTDYGELQSRALAHFPLNDSSGTVCRNLNGPDGVYVNMTIDDPLGVGDRCIYFGESTNGSISVPHSSALALEATSFSISAWVKRDGTGVLESVIEKYDYASGSDYGGWILRIVATDAVRFGPFDDSPEEVESTLTVPAGTWTHIGGTYDLATKTTTVYVNGVADGTAVTSFSGSGDSTGPLRIGKYGDDTESGFFAGKIKDARVYTRALTPAEMIALADTEQCSTYLLTDDDLVGHWPLEEAAVGTHYDVAGGSHGTASGGVTLATDAEFSINLDNGLTRLGGYSGFGASDYLSAASPAWDYTSTTIRVKATLNTGAGKQTIAGQGFVSPWVMYLQSSGQLSFQFRTSAGATPETPIGPSRTDGEFVDFSLEIRCADNQLIFTDHITPANDEIIDVDLHDSYTVSGTFAWGRYASGGSLATDIETHYLAIFHGETEYRRWDFEADPLVDRVGGISLTENGSLTFSNRDIPKDNSTGLDVLGAQLSHPNPRVTPGLHSNSGTAVRFDGNGYMTATGVAELAGDWSISMWVLPDDTTTDQYISDFSDLNEAAIVKGFQDGYYNIYGTPYPTGTAADTQIPITNDEGDHIVFTVSGTTLKGYINGTEEFSETITGGDMQPSAGFFLGCAGDLSANFEGVIDNVMIWDETITAGDVLALYNIPRAGGVEAIRSHQQLLVPSGH